jgi:hypothetical protein
MWALKYMNSGLVTYLKIIRQSKFDWINWTIKHPRMLMILKSFQNIPTLCLQFSWWNI